MMVLMDKKNGEIVLCLANDGPIIVFETIALVEITMVFKVAKMRGKWIEENFEYLSEF